MAAILFELGLFSAKAFIILIVVLAILIVFFVLLGRGKDKSKGKLVVKNLNKKYTEAEESVLIQTLPKKQFKHYLKDKKAEEKLKSKDTEMKKVFVLNFMGDIKASAVSGLREEINAIINVAKSGDEVVLRLESAGGVVHGYGLAAAQLARLRAKQIDLTITIDKIAASGGYMMACIANRILSAPFAIVGSIGVIVQLPNFNRVLKDKHVEYEQIMAGEYKRTITMFGENTPEGREKMQQDIDDIHQHFKKLIKDNRPDINIQEVATGEHWLGQDALRLKLVDEIKTSDEYLMDCSKHAKLFEICYETKKPLLARLGGGAAGLLRNYLNIQ